jgi:hypothetical protein
MVHTDRPNAIQQREANFQFLKTNFKKYADQIDKIA